MKRTRIKTPSHEQQERQQQQQQRTTVSLTFFVTVLVVLINSTAALEGPSLCPTDGVTVGYSNWTTLRSDVAETNQDLTANTNDFVLCPLTIMQVDEPIRVTTPSSFHCGQNQSSIDQCIITGGEQHMIVVSETTLQGLTFRGATQTSVLISASALIQDCVFHDNTGFSVMIIETLDESGSGQNAVEISKTHFVDNRVEQSIIRSEANILQLQSSEFRTNDGMSAIEITSGHFGAEESVFYDNTLADSTIRFASSDSFLLANTNNCGAGDTSSSSSSSSSLCVGIYHPSGDNCIAFESICEATVRCHDDWKALSQALRVAETGDDLILCSETVFNLDEAQSADVPMMISINQLKVRCGASGGRDENCIIFGGDVQVQILSGSGIRFEGVTFVGSLMYSISAEGSSTSSVSFVDCEWTGHHGLSVIFLYEGGLDDVPTTHQDIPLSSNQGQTMEITQSLFSDNLVNLSVITNYQGSLLLFQSSFWGNQGEVGAISVLGDGRIGLFRSCFIANTVLTSGMLGLVFVSDGSTVLSEDNNFAEENVGNNGTECMDGMMISSDDEVCLVDRALCPGVCQTFDSTECTTSDFKKETLNPTIIPSQSPSIQPTVSQTTSQPTAGTPQPTQFPSFRPNLPPADTPIQLSPPPSSSSSPFAVPSDSSTGEVSSSIPSALPSFTQLIQTTNCESSPQIEGYANASGLIDNIEYETIDRYILCPNITFEMVIVIERRTNPLTIECGDVDIGCRWVGGENHLVVIGDPLVPLSLTVKGVTFEDAMGVSVLLERDSDLDVTFEDCVWMNNSGRAAILMNGPLSEVVEPFEPNEDASAATATITSSSSSSLPSGENENGEIPSGRRQLLVPSQDIEGRQLQDEIDVILTRCSFLDNEHTHGLIVIYQGDMQMSGVDIDNNKASGSSMVANFGGRSTIIGSTFARNVFSPKRGIVFYGENALSGSALLDSCSLSNEGSGTANSTTKGCDGIYTESSNFCIPITTCETSTPSSAPSITTEEPTLLPTFVPRACYDDLRGLQSAVLDASRQEERVTIRICRNSLLNGYRERRWSPLRVTGGDIRLVCGQFGEIEDECTFYGGDIHIRIEGEGTRVEVQGISFMDAHDVSILAGGDGDSEAEFQSCQWREIYGVGAVLVYNQQTGETYMGQRNIENLRALESPSMSVNFDSCFFENNSPSYGVIASIGGNLFLSRVVFQKNGQSRVGCIGATLGTRVGISGSCFLENSGFLDGIILVDSVSNITRNVVNYGVDNDVRIGGCRAIFQGREDGCVDLGVCRGECLEFGAASCGSVLSANRPIPETPPPVLLPSGSWVEAPVVALPSVTSGDDNDSDGGNVVIYGTLAVIAFVVLFIVYSTISSSNAKKRAAKEAVLAKKKGGKKGKKGKEEKKGGKKGKKEKKRKKGKGGKGEKQPWWMFGRRRPKPKKEESGIDYTDGDNDYDDFSDEEVSAKHHSERHKKKNKKPNKEKDTNVAKEESEHKGKDDTPEKNEESGGDVAGDGEKASDGVKEDNGNVDEDEEENGE